MHCPRCGQQQVSEEIKFCSRCGFKLGLVSELLANDGILPQLAELYKGRSRFFTRKNGVIFSILWFIFFVMMLPAFFAIAGADDGAGVLAVFGVFTTIMFLIVSLGFLRKAPKSFDIASLDSLTTHSANLHGHTPLGALPPQQSQPASSYMPPEGAWRSPDTGEFARPGSVTDSTTKLLKKEDS